MQRDACLNVILRSNAHYSREVSVSTDYYNNADCTINSDCMHRNTHTRSCSYYNCSAFLSAATASAQLLLLLMVMMVGGTSAAVRYHNVCMLFARPSLSIKKPRTGITHTYLVDTLGVVALERMYVRGVQPSRGKRGRGRVGSRCSGVPMGLLLMMNQMMTKGNRTITACMQPKFRKMMYSYTNREQP